MGNLKGVDTLLEVMVDNIIANPIDIYQLDYDMACELVFLLYAVDELEAAETCVLMLGSKYGKEKTAIDLSNAAKRVLKIFTDEQDS